MHPFVPSLLIITLSFALSLFLTGYVRKILLRRAVLDIPNERSSHTTPTPRGGGWAVVLVLITGMVLTAFNDHSLATHSFILAGTFLLALISWLDDRKGLSARLRLGIHLLAATLGTLAFTHDQTLFAGHIPFWLDRAITILGWAWFMNLYNFMDGIDGITGAASISLATGVCIILGAAGLSLEFLDTLTLVITGACLGFLVFNWHPAKIFLGDIGSVPLGYLLGFALITLAVHGLLLPALILSLYYLADSGIIITRRAIRGEKIWQPHRQHFYQVAARGLGRHDRVVYAIILGNIGLLGCAVLALSYPILAASLAIATVAILLRWMHKAGSNQEATTP